jgi:hypothetical protein
MHSPRLTLRALPLSVRLTLAVFLCAVGVGYGSALVQVHFQDSPNGKILPDGNDLVRKFNGEQDPAKRVSTLERLLRTPENEDVPFTGQGSMARAFTDKSAEWKSELRKRPEADLRPEREGERVVIQEWVKNGLSRADFDADHFARPPALADLPITKEFLNEDGTVKVRSLFTERCVRCHCPDGDDQKAAKFPLVKYEQIKPYAKVDTGAMSLPALAQSTHTHMLSFAMLFCMTGVIFGLTSYPGWLRVPLAPLVLVAQVCEIACWWLGRIEGPTGVLFARVVLVMGGFVGMGLAMQIVLSLFDLFGSKGKALLVVLLIAAGLGVWILKQQVVDPQLRREAPASPPVATGGLPQRSAHRPQEHERLSSRLDRSVAVPAQLDENTARVIDFVE